MIKIGKRKMVLDKDLLIIKKNNKKHYGTLYHVSTSQVHFVNMEFGTCSSGV